MKAGLVPSLRRGAVPGSEQWLVTDMFPGSYPYEELAAALLRVAVERPDDLVEELARDELGIRRVAKRILPAESELLLVVDQFEELFTLTAEETRRQFLAGLTALADDPRSLVRVLVTLRADFLDHPLRYPEFGELLRAGMVAVAAPSDDELAEAIEQPARRVGVRYESGLVSQILADVRDQPGALPLLQYALTELFAGRASDTLTLEGYVATGGVVGALGHRAENLYARLRPAAQAACRQIFLRLVGADPTAQDTRRRVRRSELRQLELDPDAVEEVLASYGEHRLLTFDREPLTRTPTVEVAHEAILFRWERLHGWIEERRGDLLLHRRLVEAAAEWQDTGRDPEYLPREGRLAQFEAWADATDLALTAGERKFLAEARAAADATARRRARRRRATLAGFAVLAAAASVLAAFALVLRDQARDDARLATARQLAASAEANLEVDPERSILLAIEAAETTRRHDGTMLPEAEQALHAALATSRVLMTVDGVGAGPASDTPSPSPPMRPGSWPPTSMPRPRAFAMRERAEAPDARRAHGRGARGRGQPEREHRRDRKRRRHREALERRHGRPGSRSARASRRRLRDPVQRGRHAACDARRRSRGASLGRPDRPIAPGAPRRTRAHQLSRRLGRGRRVRRPRPRRRLAVGTRNRSLSRRRECVRPLVRRSGRGRQGSARRPHHRPRRQPRRHATRRRQGGKRRAPAVRVAVREAARRRPRPRNSGHATSSSVATGKSSPREAWTGSRSSGRSSAGSSAWR